jgi:hypothetical protein
MLGSAVRIDVPGRRREGGLRLGLIASDHGSAPAISPSSNLTTIVVHASHSLGRPDQRAVP